MPILCPFSINYARYSGADSVELFWRGRGLVAEIFHVFRFLHAPIEVYSGICVKPWSAMLECNISAGSEGNVRYLMYWGRVACEPNNVITPILGGVLLDLRQGVSCWSQVTSSSYLEKIL